MAKAAKAAKEKAPAPAPVLELVPPGAAPGVVASEFRALTPEETKELGDMDSRLRMLDSEQRRIAAERGRLNAEEKLLQGDRIAINMLAHSLHQKLGVEKEDDLRRTEQGWIVRVKPKNGNPKGNGKATITTSPAPAAPAPAPPAGEAKEKEPAPRR